LSDRRAQKTNFRANCTKRPGSASEISPKFGELMSLLGSRTLAWFKNVEEFRAELRAPGLANRNVLDCGEIPLFEAGSLYNVAAFIAELSGLRGRIKGLKGSLVEPFLRRARAVIRIADKIGPVAGEADEFLIVGIHQSAKHKNGLRLGPPGRTST